ncbi:hypothetical protein SAMN05880501_102227 [Ureibacillus xyleni]|uniref:Uncharacterized protein n=1 Tax=Ureibacillus xyleni TaxID=614648 RepID=A0A285RY61_9BACL|nr:hypothetical protein [Ureibacillus xyleni]SOB99540.1 hypothetical protein SAMN05880501_102227 [Ureibacillus xyleni]
MQFQNRNVNLSTIQRPIVSPPTDEIATEENSNNSNNNNNNNELFVARLGAFGGLVSTIGGIISTYASFLALEQLQQQTIENNMKTSEETSTSTTEDERIKQLEMQVSYLMKELEKMKSANKKNST